MEENATQQQAQPVEQITKVPVKEVERPKKKDPKKVAAGKILARKNYKEAREAAAKLKEREAQESAPVSFSSSYDKILKASALVGNGFTLYHGWSAVSGELKKRFEASSEKRAPIEIEEPEPETEVQTPKTPKGIDMD